MTTPPPVHLQLGPTPLPVRAIVGATPLPVKAIVGATPLPVHNADKADWGLTYGIPVGSLVASLAAATFAGLALRYIGKQIRIANTQTALATDALTATTDSVALARQDLDATLQSLDATKKALDITIDQAQKADALRAQRPNLMASLDYEIDEVRIPPNERVTIYARVHNEGSRAAEDCILRMYFPQAFRDPYDVQLEERAAERERRRRNPGAMDMWLGSEPPILRPARIVRGERASDLDELQTVDGLGDVYVIEDDARRPVVRSVPVVLFFVDVWVPEGEHTVHWEIEAEGIRFPEGRPYGKIKVLASTGRVTA